jgi:hypothetical protein
MKPARTLILAMLVAMQGAAYDHRLGSHAIREAYFFGSGDQYAEVLAIYTKNLPVPKTGPHVAQIEVRTPFRQVIEISREHSVGYSAQSAERDYKKNPATVQVRVQIRATATYVIGLNLAVSPCKGATRIDSYEDCFPFFRYSFSQEKEIKPMSSYGVPIYSAGDGENGSILVGADIWFVFSTADIASKPFLVTVSGPRNVPCTTVGGQCGWIKGDGPEVSAEFDLAALR